MATTGQWQSFLNDAAARLKAYEKIKLGAPVSWNGKALFLVRNRKMMAVTNVNTALNFVAAGGKIRAIQPGDRLVWR